MLRTNVAGLLGALLVNSVSSVQLAGQSASAFEIKGQEKRKGGQKRAKAECVMTFGPRPDAGYRDMRRLSLRISLCSGVGCSDLANRLPELEKSYNNITLLPPSAFFKLKSLGRGKVYDAHAYRMDPFGAGDGYFYVVTREKFRSGEDSGQWCITDEPYTPEPEPGPISITQPDGTQQTRVCVATFPKASFTPDRQQVGDLTFFHFSCNKTYCVERRWNSFGENECSGPKCEALAPPHEGGTAKEGDIYQLRSLTTDRVFTAEATIQVSRDRLGMRLTPTYTTAEGNGKWCILGSESALAAKGDPHLQNVKGEAFDVMQTGNMLLLEIPRRMSTTKPTSPPDLAVRVDIERLGVVECGPTFITGAYMTGRWLGVPVDFRSGSIADPKHKRKPKRSFGIRLDNKEWISHAEFEQLSVKFGKISADASIATMERMFLLKVRSLRIAVSQPKRPRVFLDVQVTGLQTLNVGIGGLLGVDDHSAVEKEPAECRAM